MERLDKLVAGRMCISRTDAKALVRRGLVTVNGQTAVSPEMKCGEGDAVVAQGRPLLTRQTVYIMMNKPTGVVSATRDRNKETVVDLVPEELRRKGLFPAGRLDKDTEGFLLLTDDGDFAHRILSPKRHVPKTYQARLDRPVDLEAVARLFGSSMDLGGGDKTSPAGIKLLEAGDNPLVQVTIYEGVYHQIKRMFEKAGCRVAALRRVAMGGLELDASLASGECRLLEPDEVALIEAGQVAL